MSTGRRLGWIAREGVRTLLLAHLHSVVLAAQGPFIAHEHEEEVRLLLLPFHISAGSPLECSPPPPCPTQPALPSDAPTLRLKTCHSRFPWNDPLVKQMPRNAPPHRSLLGE
ncbi:hypothetical protein DFH07DRAFT_954829 [Mycena maculata]|uniref:Secreted protein n=1 Tax=Mycena maculata TaxID=230809 RepID=A0AAD7JPY2_9AGAR|nr:hypothetical protein DFH07DRAFT_954829 [Mycena maculata]